MKHKGKISIGRSHGSSGDSIRIELTDEKSGCRCVEIGISVELFGSIVTGLGFQECEFELHTANVGKKREVKTEDVPFNNPGYSRDEKKAKAAMRRFEIDGWTGRLDDMLNHHRKTKTGYNVTFIRFIDP